MGRTKYAALFAVPLLLALAGAAFLVSIAERKTEAKQAYLKVVEIQQNEPDPATWGQNFQSQYDSWTKTRRTADLVDYGLYGRYGGPEPHSKLHKNPALKRLFAGYPFSVEYNEERGHAWAIDDVKSTKRLGDNKPGTCLTCKSSNNPTLLEELGPAKFYATPMKDLIAQYNPEHSISCADCHDAKTMSLRISRPAFVEALAERGTDVSKATRQEMRTYVCAQCHVEYYFKGEGKYLVFPWKKGLKVEDIESYYDDIGFSDWTHEETKAPLVKIQHPEFELSSTGIHTRAGVTCADCHMPYQREGGVKVSDHWVRSPLMNLTNACTTCHRVSEEELRGRVLEIQDRTLNLLLRAEQALLDAQDAIVLAMDKGASNEALKDARQLHRRSFIRVDFVSAENSMGFHSPQEAARILGDAIDYARQAELAAGRVLGGQKQ